MSKEKPAEDRDKGTDWSEEGADEIGGDDLSSEAIQALERAAEGESDELDEAGDQEDDRGASEEDDRDTGRDRYEEDEDAPKTLEEARDRLSELEERRHREKKSMRRTIKELRTERRQRRMAGEENLEAGDEKPSELPDKIEFEIDEAGNPVLPKEKFEQYVKAAGRRPADGRRDEIRKRLEDQRTQAQEQYQEIREDYLEDAPDPDIAEAAVERLEGAYQWLNRQTLRELKSGAAPPETQQDLFDLFEETGLDEDFEERYPGVRPDELIEASGNFRKFTKLVDRQVEAADDEDRPSRRRRSARSRRDEDEDEDRPRRRSARRGSRRRSSREDLRRPSRRSMRRRGASGVRAESNPSLERIGNMDVEDFLSLPRADIDKIERMAGRPPRRRR